MPEVSKGSSLLATLGFIAESLWDSRSLASIKIRARCSEDGRTPPRSLRECHASYFGSLSKRNVQQPRSRMLLFAASCFLSLAATV